MDFEDDILNMLDDENVIKQVCIKKAKEKQATRLKELRTSQQLTQEQLAELLGCTPQHICYIENKSRNLSEKLALKASEVFNVNFKYILGTSDYKTDLERQNAINNKVNTPHREMKIIEYLWSFGCLPLLIENNSGFEDNNILKRISNDELKFFFDDLNDYAEFKLRKLLKNYASDIQIEAFFNSIE